MKQREKRTLDSPMLTNGPPPLANQAGIIQWPESRDSLYATGNKTIENAQGIGTSFYVSQSPPTSSYTQASSVTQVNPVITPA